MGSTDNLQEDCMLFHGDLTKLRRQRESLVSKKAISKTTTLNMQHAFFIFLLWFVEASSQWYFVWKTHRIWSKKHTDTAHVLPVQSVYTKHGAIQYVAQYPDGTSIRTLETRTQFLRGPFQLSVNKVFRMKAEHFSFKMKVLAIWKLAKQSQKTPFCLGE